MKLRKKAFKNDNLPGLADEQDEIDFSDEELRDAASPVNLYYEKVSIVYSTVRYLLLVFLVLLIAVASIKNSESITYDNLMFLMKDLGSVAESSSGGFADISYNPDQAIAFSGFRKNLALAAPSGLKIYEGDGDLLFEGSDKFSTPRLETSDRYLLLYDFNSSGFALYNSFARIYTEKLEHDITGADISDSGMFALVSKTKEYNSAVLLYNKNCRMINRYLSEDRVVDVALDRTGERICIISFSAENASFKTKVMIAEPGDDFALSTLELGDVFPLACEYTDDGNLTVLCDKALYFYDREGTLIGSYELGGEPQALYCGSEGTVIAFSENTVSAGSSVKVLSGSGELVFSGETEGRASAVLYKDGCAFVLEGNRLIRIDTSNGEKDFADLDGGGKTMIVYSKNDVMVCSNSKAEYYDFSK
ncbi:MAG: hypothetical protein IJ303_05030 [Clostridia bacterium]|nr:hypothetical protein [Clostridia bacterium]